MKEASLCKKLILYFKLFFYIRLLLVPVSFQSHLPVDNKNIQLYVNALSSEKTEKYLHDSF